MHEKQKQHDGDLLSIVQGWQRLEEAMITQADKLRRKSGNPFTKMITNLIIHDSEKHKLVQEMIITTLAEQALHISPDEFNEVSGLINRHVAAEEEAMKLAESAMERCREVSTHFLLSYLISDEKKHHNLVERMDELKLASIPTSASARA